MYKKCPPCNKYKVCDLDTGKCISSDITPVLSQIRLKDDLLITGSVKNVYAYLFDMGYSKTEISKMVQYFYESELLSSQTKGIVNSVFTFNDITIDTRPWDPRIKFYPDFLSTNIQNILLNSINPFIDKSIPLNESPFMVQCLNSTLYRDDFKNNSTDKVIINRLPKGKGTLKKKGAYFKGDVAVISLGSTVKMNFDKKFFIPLFPGSLLIIPSDIRLDYDISIPETDRDIYPSIYPNDKDKVIIRENRYSVTFVS